MESRTAPKAPADDQARSGFLDKLAVALQNRHQPGSWFGRALRLLGVCHLLLQLGTLVAVVLVIVGMRTLGERNLTTGFMLFLPMQLLLIPLAAIFPVALISPHRWICIPQVILGLYIIGPYMGWRSGHPTGASEPALTILSYNFGQKGTESMSDFINSTDPDVMLLQEAGNRAAGYKRQYPQFIHGHNEYEFTGVSKLPVSSPETLRLGVSEDGSGGIIAGTRSVLEWEGRQVALYNVHMPTPRGALRALMGPALLHGVVKLPGKTESREDYMRYWNYKIRLTRELREVLEKEKLPFIVAGDFNMPHQGYLYRYFTKTDGGLRDSHREAGAGYGFTFPGSSGNPLTNMLTFSDPWIRIDYIFASSHWKVQKCVTEPRLPSQHRAVVAELTLVSDS